MSYLLDALASGTLSALTWAGLVWLSPSDAIRDRLGWWQGIGLVAAINLLGWVVGAAIGINLWFIWAIVFFALNVLVGWLMNRLAPRIQISLWWATFLHPLAIAAMNVLLGGALGEI